MARCDQFSLVSEKSWEGVLVALGVLPNSTLLYTRTFYGYRLHLMKMTVPH